MGMAGTSYQDHNSQRGRAKSDRLEARDSCFMGMQVRSTSVLFEDFFCWRHRFAELALEAWVGGGLGSFDWICSRGLRREGGEGR